MEREISYPKVSSMKPAPNPFLTIESKKTKPNKQTEVEKYKEIIIELLKKVELLKEMKA
jgi:hypothetical protein